MLNIVKKEEWKTLFKPFCCNKGLQQKKKSKLISENIFYNRLQNIIFKIMGFDKINNNNEERSDRLCFGRTGKMQ